MYDPLFDKKLNQYAEVLVKIGVNLRPGQRFQIRSPIECADFARRCVAAGYEAGASEVTVVWSDDFVDRQKFLYADEAVFDEYPEWEKAAFQAGVGEDTATLEFYVSDPDNLNGVDVNRVYRQRGAKFRTCAGTYEKIGSGRYQRCTAQPPIPALARTTFPDLDTDEAMQKMWEAVFQCVRCRGDNDPVAEWRAYASQMTARAERLNRLGIQCLHYRNSLGTDFTAQLPEGAHWNYAFSEAASGAVYAENLPTEEIFSAPVLDGVNGTVAATYPIIYQGRQATGVRFTFQDGRVTEFSAQTGEDMLRAMLSFDEGASRLGELALVPKDSPIASTGILFSAQLYAENASCHLALGMAIPCSIEGGGAMSPEQLRRNGLNRSGIHVDFMIGSDDLTITGLTGDGREVPVFTDGLFAEGI